MKNKIMSAVAVMAVFLAGCATAPSPDNTNAAVPEEPAIRIEDVLVEGGSFIMGDAWVGENPDGIPVHPVTLNSFYMGITEVDQALYERVMGSNPSAVKNPAQPVESVTWYEAVEFCNRVSDALGLESVYAVSGSTVRADLSKNGYHLPTEAEWEYAARSRGRDDRKWSGTNNEKKIEEYAWYYWDDPAPHPVGTKKPNELGIFDMTGNVEEWCGDWYGPYTKTGKTNPTGPASGKYRVARGGAWNWDADYSRTVRRDGFYPDKRYEVLGFRLARKGD